MKSLPGYIRLIIRFTDYNLTNSTNIREVQTVTIMGAGNVAWHLGYHLKRAGIRILEVYNRTPERGEMLARELNSKYMRDPASLDKTADLVVVSVSDDAILEIATVRLSHGLSAGCAYCRRR